jgi:DNA primase catalytic core, N-terminal domain
MARAVITKGKGKAVPRPKKSVLLSRLSPWRRPDPLRGTFRASFLPRKPRLLADLALATESELLGRTIAFCQLQLHPYSEAVQYLRQRGLQDPDLIAELGHGYAPGGNLRRHLADLGYPFELLLRTGLINHQGRDAFCRRVIFPCCQQGRVINLYGRSVGTAFPHRLLPRSKGGLFAWESVAFLFWRLECYIGDRRRDMRKLVATGALLAASALGLWHPQPAMAGDRVVIVYRHHHRYHRYYRHGHYYYYRY